ncbi:hypothetical protein HanRHA438_Chr03g0100431 [Helianthus annuus]|nr:hypothetical protein HanRHA438_Chr03g0100431 [Helianthus annuus]
MRPKKLKGVGLGNESTRVKLGKSKSTSRWAVCRFCFTKNNLETRGILLTRLIPSPFGYIQDLAHSTH